MAQRRPGMSITLPRNFTFHPGNGDEPKTPDQPFPELDPPPPPHHSTLRYKRPSIDIFAHLEQTSSSISSQDIPIPSIEIPRDSFEARPSWHQRATEPATTSRLRLSSRRMMVAPKTPPAQIHETALDQDQNSKWAFRGVSNSGGSIDRPTSACSNISDSSISSTESFTSRPSFGGSCTSPESDVQDPFVPSISVQKDILESPSKPGKSAAKCLNPVVKQRWTLEMDNHLWNTYQIYLQDPTITPFKMVPGSVPPLGVSHRVAREAKRTWPKVKKTRNNSAAPGKGTLRNVYDETHAVSSETPSTVTGTRSGSSTPTATIEPPRVIWPRSESATRRRLKELCKRKFSIAPHYQRLLQSRSPSPFLDPFTRRSSRSSRLGSSSSNSSISFATRDLGISLGSSSMTGPLAQLTTNASPAEPDADEWFNKPVEPSSSQASSSSQVGLGIDAFASPNDIPRLGSPFIYNTWGPESSRRYARPSTPSNQCDTIHVTGPRLMSPVRLDPFSNAHKRRAQHQLEDELSPGGTDMQRSLHDLFGPSKPGDLSQRRVRLRNRGVTLGAVGGRERLNRLFTPPPHADQMDTSQIDPLVSTQENQSHSNVTAQIKRLGSPFELDEQKNSKPTTTTSPRHTPSVSDPFVNISSTSYLNAPSISETLEAYDQSHAQTRPSFNETEIGISDAERIRRQILQISRS